MNVIQDLVSVASTIAKDGSVANMTNILAPRARLRSISSFAGNSIYYFPMLCSSNVVPSTAGMTLETLERAYVHFVRATFALMPAMRITGTQVNVEEYLKQFHQNIGLDVSYGGIRLNESAGRPWETLPNMVLNEAIYDKIPQGVKAVANELKDGYDDNTYKPDIASHIKQGDNTQHISYTREFKDATKKLNGAEPSVVMVTASFILDGVTKTVDVSLPIGVKTNLKVLESDSLCDRVVDSLIGKGFVHDMIRWSTGEMLSLKDILFGVDKIKGNINRSNDEASQWFTALQRRKRLTSISMPALNKKAFLPNTAVVLSMGDVRIIETQYGINVLDAKYAKRLIEDNFLLSFVIADDMTETLHVMHDGHLNFEEYPYTTVSRENAANNKEMATLIKAIGSMR
jgi:hypothetical protein